MVSFSGVGSGLDLSALVEQVVAAEKIPANILAKRKTASTRQSTALGDLVSKLKSLDSKLASFDTKSELRAVNATTSDAGRVKINASGEASPGSYRVTVDRLARAQSSQSRAFATLATTAGTSGTLSIQVGDDASAQIEFDASDTIGSIAAKIRESDARVNANVLFTGSEYRLLISSRETGVANAITFSESGGSLGFLSPTSMLSEAQDAQMTLNGLQITRGTNQMADVIPGLTFDLISETPAGGVATDVSVASDKEGVKKKVKEIVDGYNEVARFMLAQMDDSAANKDHNNLFGDSSLQALQRSLGRVLSRGYDYEDNTISLGSLGIKIGSDGLLSLDETKFGKAYDADPGAIEELFAGDGGLVESLGELVELYTRSGDGVLVARQKGLQARVKSFDQEIEQIHNHAEAVGERLRKQFAALDQTMTNLQSQTTYLAALFA